jgi:SAM-dependent methyltransferase
LRSLRNIFSLDCSRHDDLRIGSPLLQPDRLDYSLRRYFVDEFHFRHVPTLPSGSLVLDLGGNKIRKRGQFDIERYNLRVVYANLVSVKQPDLQIDAAYIPCKDDCFDVVVCSELLEHVPDPIAVLHEVYRVLRASGILLICVPFLFHIHSDPYDYGRYTDYYWRKSLAEVGFVDIQIERQGLFWSVLVDMLCEFVHHKAKEGRPKSAWMRRQIVRLLARGKRMALTHDARSDRHGNPFFGKFTTGFGIKAAKQ